ncbi:a-factor receptor [Lignoscripta atroalba]|nr:a-factor receptor [Lignoscripta atroalba]
MDNYTELSPVAIAVPLLSFMTLVLNVPPFIWHVKNRNLPATCLVFWVVISNLFNFINALIWPTDDVTNWWHGAVLCDIEVKLTNAATLGLTGSVACIMRSLAMALDTKRTVLMHSRAQRRRQLAFEMIFCFGLPVYMIIIHYVVQPSRYYIFAIAGCTPSFDNSWPSVVLVYIWPPIFCLVDAYYCGLVIFRLRKYRKEFAAVLHSSNSKLTQSRFMRLFLASLLLLVVFLPLQFYVLYRNALFPLQPYSWAVIHGPTWWDIIMVPTGGVVQFDRWIRIALGFTVFFCFGLGQDAIAMYRDWLLKCGLGKIFPKLRRQQQTSRTPGRNLDSRTESFSSKARLFFERKFSSGGSTISFASRNNSIPTEVNTPSPSDPKKTFPPLTTIRENQPHNSDEKRLPAIPARSFRSWLSKTHSSSLSSDIESQPEMRGSTSEIQHQSIFTNDWSTSVAAASPTTDTLNTPSQSNRNVGTHRINGGGEVGVGY